jgi:hypothetical protein
LPHPIPLIKTFLPPSIAKIGEYYSFFGFKFKSILQAKNQILERQLEDRKLGAQVCKLQTKNHTINLENTELKEQLEATTEEFQQLKAQNHVLVKENETLKEKVVNYKQKEDNMVKMGKIV